MSLKPWREIIVPHPDVLNGTFQQSEFAADLTAVQSGRATPEYGDAKAFFERTFITEGMGRLLTQVAQRLSGKGGEPVIQLQTAFGGGKTHTLLAVFHLASRKCPIGELAGIPDLISQAKVMDVPQAKIAVLDGTAHAPGQPWKHGTQSIRTLWGELAWQLGQEEGFALVKESDAKGTSPGKDILCALLKQYAPCVVLLDELVVYIRQFSDGQQLSGGSYESNLSFVQSLTEAAKMVPNAVVLASLPESDNQAGGLEAYLHLRHWKQFLIGFRHYGKRYHQSRRLKLFGVVYLKKSATLKRVIWYVVLLPMPTSPRALKFRRKHMRRAIMSAWCKAIQSTLKYSRSYMRSGLRSMDSNAPEVF